MTIQLYYKTKKELKNDRKKLMEGLIKMGGRDKETKINYKCGNELYGWTKTNNPKKTCGKKTGYSNRRELCAIKSGKAKTDTAAKLIYSGCEDNYRRLYDDCMLVSKEKYQPTLHRCIDQAYLEN